MSVLSRVHQSTDTDSAQISSGKSGIREADPPVVRRLRLVVGQLTSFVQQKGDERYSRYGWLLNALMSEVLDEIAEGQSDKSEYAIGEYFAQLGRVIEWCGSGDDTILPPGVRQYLADKHPAELLAIEAAHE